MTPGDRAQRRLQELAARMEPALRAAFLRYAATLAPEQITELVRLLEAGDVDGAAAWITSRPEASAAAAAVRATFAEALIRLTAATTKDLGRELRLTVAAPVANPSLIAAVRRWEDQAFARVLADVRAGVRETIATELARGIGPRQVAVALKGNIAAGGLTAYDRRIIGSFRAALEEGRFADVLGPKNAAGKYDAGRTLRDKRSDALLDRLRTSGRPLTPAQIDKMVTAYERKLVAHRAETFARTAAIQAANEASVIGWRAAVEQGAIPAAEVRRYWVVAADERLCPVCEPIPGMNAAGVGLDGQFATPNGPLFSPPAHPACRCTSYVRRERAGVRQLPQPGTTRLILPRTA